MSLNLKNCSLALSGLLLVASCGRNPHDATDQENAIENWITYPIQVTNRSEPGMGSPLTTYTFQYSEDCTDGTLFSGQLTNVFSKNGVVCHFKITSLSDGSNTYTSVGAQAKVDFDSSGNITSSTSGFYSSGSGSKAIHLYHVTSPSSITIDMVDGPISEGSNSSVFQQQISLPSSGIASQPCGLTNTCTFTNFTFSSNVTNCDSTNKKITLHMVNTTNSSDTADVIFTYSGNFGVTANSLRYTTLGIPPTNVALSSIDICQTNPANILATNGWSFNQGGGAGINSYTATLVYDPTLNSSTVNTKLSSGATYSTTYSLGTGGTLALSTATIYSYSFNLPIH